MSMTIILKPETERLVREELDSGHFHTVDEIIIEGIQARREKEPLKETGPLAFGSGREIRAEAAEHIREARRGNRLPPGVTIRDLIDEGRL
jgi:hypothetical protein